MGKLIQTPMDSVRMCLKGAYHEVNQFKDDVYYIYSRRDKKNVPVIFRCGEGRDSVTRVWSVEFPSPVKSKETVCQFQGKSIKEKTMIALTVILVILAATRKKPFWRFIFWMLAVLSIIL